MSAKIIAEFHVKPEQMSEFKKLLVEILPGTRGFASPRRRPLVTISSFSPRFHMARRFPSEPGVPVVTVTPRGGGR